MGLYVVVYSYVKKNENSLENFSVVYVSIVTLDSTPYEKVCASKDIALVAGEYLIKLVTQRSFQEDGRSVALASEIFGSIVDLCGFNRI